MNKAIEVNGTIFEVGGQFTVAGKQYEVYNVMPGTGLVGFAKLNKSGQRASLKSAMSLSVEQIDTLMKIDGLN